MCRAWYRQIADNIYCETKITSIYFLNELKYWCSFLDNILEDYFWAYWLLQNIVGYLFFFLGMHIYRREREMRFSRHCRTYGSATATDKTDGRTLQRLGSSQEAFHLASSTQIWCALTLSSLTRLTGSNDSFEDTSARDFIRKPFHFVGVDLVFPASLE